MHSFILYFKSVKGFSIALAFILCFEIFLHFIPNLHYLDGRGAFFTYYKRYIAERGPEDYDIVMYGDSRSLSLRGFPRSETYPYSLYNFSLPAAGPWYFKYFFKKYLTNHPKPKLVIWAADPQQFSMKKTMAFHDNPPLWNEFKHRLLNLFSITETWEQYQGKELFFILKEYFPHSILSVRHRQGFESILSSRLNTLFKLPSMVKENLIVEAVVSESYGQINLGNFFTVPNIREVALAEKESQLKGMQKADVNLEPLKQFLDYCKEQDVKVVVLNIPRLTEFNRSPYFQTVVPLVQDLLIQYPNASYLEFENMEYELELFSESIHYNPEGEKVVNKEFLEKIVPKLFSEIESSNVKK